MKRPDLGAWRKAHARNPIIVRPLRFLRAKLLPALLWGR